MTADSQQGVWSRHAGQWQRVGAPLKPGEQDATFMLEAVAASSPPSGEPLAIGVLGVTPEVIQLPWPAGSRLVAFDHSEAMIAAVWQPHPRVDSSVHHARWQALPLEASGIDAMVGDGSLNVLPDLASYAEVFGEMARVLKPQGLLCLRCFIHPDRLESVEEVTQDALSGRIGSFHALKWRLAMCLSKAPDFSVCVARIHALFESAFPDRHSLAESTGWPRPVIDTIDAYRSVETCYTFPVLKALENICAPHFSVAGVRCGSYELASRCPTITFRNMTSRISLP